MAEKHNCAKGVYYGSIMKSFPCSRNGIIEEDGKWWRKQHAPSSVEARRIARDAEWRRRWDERENARDRTARLAQLKDAVIDAAVAYAAWCKRDGPVTPEAEEQAVCTAVDDYFAAKEDS
jgi:hypothetical protein